MTGPGREQQVVRALPRRARLDERQNPAPLGTRRLRPDLVTLASTPSGAARLTKSTGSGTRTKSLTRTSRSSDQRSPVHDAISNTSASRSSRADAAMWNDSSSSSANGRISVRTPRPLGTRVPVTGLVAMSRSRTAQAKNADSDARKRFTDDSASPDLLSAIRARVTSRS